MKHMDIGMQAAMTVHDAGRVGGGEARWYRDEQCWNCDAPVKAPKRGWLGALLARRPKAANVGLTLPAQQFQG